MAATSALPSQLRLNSMPAALPSFLCTAILARRKEIVVFKEGYRSRSYCLSECTQASTRLGSAEAPMLLLLMRTAALPVGVHPGKRPEAAAAVAAAAAAAPAAPAGSMPSRRHPLLCLDPGRPTWPPGVLAARSNPGASANTVPFCMCPSMQAGMRPEHQQQHRSGQQQAVGHTGWRTVATCRRPCGVRPKSSQLVGLLYLSTLF